MAVPILLLTALALVFALSACGEDEPPTKYTVSFYNSAGESIAEPVTVTAGGRVNAPEVSGECAELGISGWALEKGGEPLQLSEYRITEDTCLYAVGDYEEHYSRARLEELVFFSCGEDGVFRRGVDSATEELALWVRRSAYSTVEVFAENGEKVDIGALPLEVGDNPFRLVITSRDRTASVEIFLSVYRARGFNVTFDYADGREAEVRTVDDVGAYFFPSADREGYTFLGWQVGDKVYGVGERLVPSDNMTALALWRPNKAMLDYVGVDIPDGELSHGERLTLPVPSLSGYRFLGYVLPSGNAFTDAGGEMLAPVSLIEDGGRVEISASFEPIEYEIWYVGLNTAVNLNPTVYTAEDGTLRLAEPDLPWYDFQGWYLDEDCTECVTELSATVNGAVTLYAAWEKSAHTATYYVNGEVYREIDFDVDSMDWAEPPLPVREHYTVTWSEYSVTDSDISVNAIFTPIDYTVTLDAAEGELEMDKIGYNADSEATLLPTPSRRGYSFLGWYDSEGEMLLRVGGEYIYGTVSLTARWEVVKYSIKYENISHVSGLVLPDSYTVLDDDIPLPDIEEKGFTYHGWSVDGIPSDKISTSLAKDITVTARLVGDSHEIALHTAYGELAERTVAVEYGSSYKLPVPVSEGRRFLGWYSSEEGEAVRFTDSDGGSVSDYLDHGSRMLFALWGDVMHTVTYITGTGNAEILEVAHGTLFDTTVAVNVPTGKAFEGWFDADGARLDASSTVLSDTVAYARFVESTPISTAEELVAMRLDPNGRYHLTKDIDLRGAEWVPFEFGGTLIGGGHKIKNFVLKYNNTSEFGFFTANNCTIEGICLSDFVYTVSASVGSEVCVGALVGRNSGDIRDCSITDCTVTVDFTANVSCPSFWFGLIAGKNLGVITGCSSSSSVDMDLVGAAMGNNRQLTALHVGGLVGESSGTLSGLYYGGSITVRSEAISSWNGYQQSYTRVGGIVGNNSGTVSECYSDATLDYVTTFLANDHNNDYDFVRIGVLVGTNGGEVSSSFSGGSLKLYARCESYAGGLVGLNTTKGSIDACYSTVSLDISGADVGGLVGLNSNRIVYSYAAGSIITQRASGSVGGFVGNTESGSVIMNCYSASRVDSAGTAAGAFFGSYNGAAHKCYYSKGVRLTAAGAYPAPEDLDPIAESVDIDLLRSEVLRDMGWGESWTILSGYDPMLPWETSHGHDYEVYTVPPTCESYGYTLWYCTDCGRHFTRDLTAPHGHNYGRLGSVVEPTCTSDGYTVRECYYCLDTAVFDRILALGHIEGERLEDKCTSPTCTEEGAEYFVCAREGCGREYFKILEANGHSENITLGRLLPTCSRREDGEGGYIYVTEDGHTEEISCSVCHEVLLESETIPAHFIEEHVITPGLFYGRALRQSLHLLRLFGDGSGGLRSRTFRP